MESDYIFNQNFELKSGKNFSDIFMKKIGFFLIFQIKKSKKREKLASGHFV